MVGVWSWFGQLYYEQNLWTLGIRVFSEMKMKHLRQDPDPGCASLQIQLVSDIIASSCPAHSHQSAVRSQLSAACENLLPSFLSSTPAPCRDQHLNEKQWGNHMLGNMENGRETHSTRPVSNVWLWLDYCPKIAPTATDKVAIVCCWWGEYLLKICIPILGRNVFSCPPVS